MRFNCAECDQPIEADASMEGMVVTCPGCQKDVTIPAPEVEQPAQPVVQQPAQAAPPPPVPRTKYTVLPFVASIKMEDSSQAAAAQLEGLIQKMSDAGWEYVRMEAVETYVAGDSGCFGFGATPPRTISLSMVVFKQ